MDYARRSAFLEAVIISCEAAVLYAARYAELAVEQAKTEPDMKRRQELMRIAENCISVPARGAKNFYEACQSFWFVQMLLQVESSGHSISPGRFDKYMYPYFKKDLDEGKITREFAQELMDCIWVKLNDLNKARDAASALSLIHILFRCGCFSSSLCAYGDLRCIFSGSAAFTFLVSYGF